MFSLRAFAYLVRFRCLYYAALAGNVIIMISFCRAPVFTLCFITLKGAFVQDVLAAHYDFKHPLSLSPPLCLSLTLSLLLSLCCVSIKLSLIVRFVELV